MAQLQDLYTELMARLPHLTWLDGLDLLLVTIIFSLLLGWVRRSRAAFLFRGEVLLVVVLLVATLSLPLPTFDWLLQMTLLVMLVTTPIIFQPELRHLLERIGRSAGRGRTVRQTTVETMSAQVVRAVETMSTNSTGALIVLEKKATLDQVVATGVPIDGQVTSELLQAIFYPKNPLHDGAVILREDRVVAAGCVLPVSQRLLFTRRRLGTRHRAAVGLSENSDALIIVVSEETGEISVARDRQLRPSLGIAALREQLLDFYVPATPPPSVPILRNRFNQIGQQMQDMFRRPTPKQLLTAAGHLSVALLLALIAWWGAWSGG